MKETTITIETTSLLILRAGDVRTMWCPECGAEVAMVMLSTGEISILGKLPGDVHRAATPEGKVLICLNSLLDAVANDQIS